MADYMYLMAKLPYLGIFPENSEIDAENIIKLEEFENIKNTHKKIEYNDFVERIEEDIIKLRTEREYFPKTLPLHISKHNPLQREIEIMKIKWNSLEMLENFEPDDNWLWVYKEKLEIVRRMQKFDKSKGIEVYLNLVEEVRRDAAKQDGAEKAEG